MNFSCAYFFLFSEEEYKRLSEALADEGTYTAVAFRYSADYYDPSQPTEEDEASKEAGGIRTSLDNTQLQKPHTYFEMLLASLPEEIQILRQLSLHTLAYEFRNAPGWKKAISLRSNKYLFEPQGTESSKFFKDWPRQAVDMHRGC